ncbi:MAG: ATP-binding protein [Opitutus sp.]|nr:ATP-binding protein [Opitutus sp.]
MDDSAELYPRPLRARLAEALADTPVVALIGPRQCGKSTLAQLGAPGRNYVSFDDETLLRTALDDPAGFVATLPDPVTIDEVQRAPELFRALKLVVDRERRPGRFLLTGSADLLLLPRLSESLAGRIEIITLHPLTEAEKARAPGAFLATLIAGKLKREIKGESRDAFPALAARLVAGGYPEPLTRAPDRARQWHRAYLRTLIERDVRDIARVRDAGEVARLLELLALRTAELLNTSSLSQDIGLDRQTIENYLAILERLFLVRRLPAWHRNEARRLVKTPKVHLLDSGLAATLSGLTAADWNTRRDRFGHLLESFVVQQLIAQAGWTDPDLRFWHYRDKDQVEVDLVITRGRQTWGVEVKASATVNESDGAGLRRLADQCGKDFKGGVLFHAGTSTLPLADPRFLAVPLEKLWTM